MTFRPTPEQEAIIEAVRSTPDNLIITALAGAAKTSTLILIAEAVNVRTLAVAFNKRIAEELQERMPPHVECKTLHGMGYRAISRFLGKKRLTVDSRGAKVFDKLSELLSALSQAESSAIEFRDMQNAIAYGAQCGWIPDGTHPRAKRLMDDEEFFERVASHAGWGWEPSSTERRIIRDVTKHSLDEALRGHISFDDMVLIPAVFPCQFDVYPLVMLDESQDWSALNHVLIGKLVRDRRLIAVGDPCQAIYGFRGAHEDSMSKLRETFDMKELLLTVSFRCPVAVAEHVRWRAPLIKSPEWAKPGEVRALAQWSADDIPEHAAIICRNNAPLFRTAMRLLRAGRRPQIAGNDIIKGLIKDMKKLGPAMMSQADALEAFETYAKQQRKRYRDAVSVNDRLECLRFFLEEAETLSVAILNASNIMAMTGPTQLMTGHKSKGLEFPDVFFLDQALISEERGGPQEANLRYVICTRSQERLTYIETEGWMG